MDVLFALVFASSTLAPCSFAIVQAPPTSISVRGDEVFTSRLHIVSQPDSPVVITGIDFHDSDLVVAPSSYELRRENITLHVLNVSDQVASEVKIRVYTGWHPRAGTGSGNRSTPPVRPGESAAIPLRGGPARGTYPGTDDVKVTVSIESMSIAGCTYRPSQRFPLAQ